MISVRYKFYCLTEFTKNKVDILMISESKLGYSLESTGITNGVAFYFT